MEHFHCIKALLIIKMFFTLKTVLLKIIHLNLWKLVSVIEWKKMLVVTFYLAFQTFLEFTIQTSFLTIYEFIIHNYNSDFFLTIQNFQKIKIQNCEKKSQNCEKLQLPFLFSGGNKKVWVFFQNGEKKVRTVRRKLNQKQIIILSLYLAILSIFSELRKKNHNWDIKTCNYLLNFFIPWQEPKMVLCKKKTFGTFIFLSVPSQYWFQRAWRLFASHI